MGSMLFLIETDEIIESVASINMTQWKHYESDSSVSTLGFAARAQRRRVWEREAAVIAPTPAFLSVVPINPGLIKT